MFGNGFLHLSRQGLCILLLPGLEKSRVQGLGFRVQGLGLNTILCDMILRRARGEQALWDWEEDTSKRIPELCRRLHMKVIRLPSKYQ